MPRIHILGASGSTLGAALGDCLRLAHVDADTLFWIPTDPPFTTRRSAEERLALLHQRVPAAGHWIFSGSAISWATPLEPLYDLIVFLRLDPRLRMERLRRREIARYGARIRRGGDMAAANAAFLNWAAAYDAAGPEMRSLLAHEKWLAAQTAPILRLDSSAPIQDLVAAILSKFRAPERASMAAGGRTNDI
jgi:adenylate kinase family enzyme